MKRGDKIDRKKIIILLMIVGLISIIGSTINYAYRIPELDKQINEKNEDLDYALSKFSEAKFGYTNSEINANTIYVLSTLMNITDVDLVFINDSGIFNGTFVTPGNYVKFKKDGKYEIHGGETVETERLIKNLLKYRKSMQEILVCYRIAQGNCSIEDLNKINEITDLDTCKKMIIPFANESTNNLNRISSEIGDLEKQKREILFHSLIFQILGIVILQIATILQVMWKGP